MSVEDSNRTRRRVIAFVVSSGGRISSGQNDNFLAWVFRKMYPGVYKHERVDALKDTLLAMEDDGMLILERSGVGRIIGASLPDGALLEPIDEEDHDLFDLQSIWLYVARLLTDKHRLQRELAGADEALGQLVAEASYVEENVRLQERVAELEVQLVDIGACDHEQEIAQLKGEHAAQMARAREEWQQLLEKSKDDFAAYRKSTQTRLSEDGQKMADLRRELRDVKGVCDLPEPVLQQLRSAVAMLRIAGT